MLLPWLPRVRPPKGRQRQALIAEQQRLLQTPAVTAAEIYRKIWTKQLYALPVPKQYPQDRESSSVACTVTKSRTLCCSRAALQHPTPRKALRAHGRDSTTTAHSIKVPNARGALPFGISVPWELSLPPPENKISVEIPGQPLKAAWSDTRKAHEVTNGWAENQRDFLSHVLAPFGCRMWRTKIFREKCNVLSIRKPCY